MLADFMLQTAQRAVEDVDVVCVVVDATDRSAPDDLVLASLREYRGTVVCALNKVDLVKPKTALLPLLRRRKRSFSCATKPRLKTFAA